MKDKIFQEYMQLCWNLRVEPTYWGLNGFKRYLQDYHEI